MRLSRAGYHAICVSATETHANTFILQTRKTLFVTPECLTDKNLYLGILPHWISRFGKFC